MKRIIFLAVIFICFLTQGKAVTIEVNCTGKYGSIEAYGMDYQNSMTKIWNINTGVNNKPVLIECNIDTEWSADILYIYAIDSQGNEHFIASRSGLVSGEYISTNLPTGKAKVVFITDAAFCGNPGEGEYYWGVESYYEVDNSYTGTIANTSYTNNQTIENATILNSLVVGMPNTPAQKIEFYGGSSSRFTFSGSAASAYDVAQTIDNTGYKINVNNTSRNYKIAIAGVDRLKILAGENFAVGTNALNAWSSGSGNNIGLGYYSLGKTTTGTYNIALGYYSLYGNTTGTNNIAHGAYSLYSNTSGGYNIAQGYYSLYGNTTGTYNIGIGYQAGRYIANGSTANATATNSLFLGRETKAQADGQTNQIVIGYNATGNGSNTVTLGGDAITKTILKGNVGIGTVTPQYALDVNGAIHAKEMNIENTIMLDSLTVGTPSNPAKKIAFYGGASSRFTFSGSAATSAYDVAQTIDSIGYKINVNNTSRNYKIAIAGVDRLKILAGENFAVGTNALNAWSSGSGNNIGLGYYSLGKTTTGTYNIALGYYSLYGNTTGTSNIAHGTYSLYSNTSGGYNIAHGYCSLYGNTTGTYNIGMGYQAGRYIANGSTANATSSYSLFLGRDTKAQADGQTNQIVIGYNATGNGSNSVTLGSDAITKTILKGNVGIDTSDPIHKLTVNGDIQVGLHRGHENVPIGYGNKIDFGCFENYDNIFIARYNNGTDNSELRINIGDDSGVSDRFAVGSTYFADNTWKESFTVLANGKVGIGTVNPDELLTVNGTVHAKKVKIDLTSPLADYVFAPDYKLMPLPEVEHFVKENRHLPAIPSAQEVHANGMDMGEFQNLLLQKIEELTLHAIEQNKTIEGLKKEIKELKEAK